ncbi:hypothetical protein BDV96DRAFT_295756 [Lophiotrema nucula]|uniref:Uncharacterized protein n=1 Tax=Lophiotrema nucula TaxID=690887 RepID=A0A6A5YKC4_9PLEO|nr:hypothetical protein BDV96DRAFT_295756 [Lophiotrema nucula]
MCEFSREEHRSRDPDGKLRVTWTTKKVDCEESTCEESESNEQSRTQSPDPKRSSYPEEEHSAYEDARDEYALQYYQPRHPDRDWDYDEEYGRQNSREIDYRAYEKRYRKPHEDEDRGQELVYSCPRDTSGYRSSQKDKSKSLGLGVLLGVAATLCVSEVVNYRTERKMKDGRRRLRERERDWGHD